MKNSKQHINASQLSQDHNAEYDIVIIGSGAGGGISAEVFAKAGFSVAIIEKGPYHDKTDFKMNEGEAYLSLYQDVASKKTKDKKINILQGRCVGGGTTVNWTASFRTPNQTLNHWQQKYALKGWSPEHMAPYFEDVEKRLSTTKWTRAFNANNNLLFQGAKKLGWHADALNRNVKNCANLGYCGTGCPIDAKQSMLTTTIPSAMKHGAVLYSQLEAWHLKHSDGKVQTLQAKALKDNLIHHKNISITIKAKIFIIASGAIASPGLMLRSNFPDPFKTIGKRTFLHPVVISAAIFSQPVNAYKGAPQTVYSDEFLWRDGVTSEKLGYKIEVPPVHPILTAITFKDFGLKHTEIMQDFANVHVQLALLRDDFNENDKGGNISLDKYQQPILDYPINNALIKSAKHALQSMAKIQYAAGANKVNAMHRDGKFFKNEHELLTHLDNTFKQPQLFSAHQMGGCAMGEDKAKSVINSDGKFHHLENVYVFDGSAFPTSVGANPQESIYALALKQSKALLKTL